MGFQKVGFEGWLVTGMNEVKGRCFGGSLLLPACAQCCYVCLNERHSVVLLTVQKSEQYLSKHN
jgi:hypothetical protein